MTENFLISVKNLQTFFHTPEGPARAVDDISFCIPQGKTLAIVGESGCGKSVTALSIMRLVPGQAGYIAGGEIIFRGQNLLTLSEREMREVRGNRISMIFQEPMTSLNPVMTVGNQITEAILLHKGCSKKEARNQAVEMLELVKIPDPEKKIWEYPHQLSGGMKQRVMIAMALVCEPDLLIADEPTTALDVTVQSQILRLMKELQEKKGTAILLITHDMGVVYEMADRIAVMYAGKIVEQADRERFFQRACHPYTTKLFDSLPERDMRNRSLSVIPGRVPSPTRYPEGCRFSDRCHKVFEKCRHNPPPALRPLEKGHLIACHLENPPSIKIRISEGEPENMVYEIPERLLELKGLKIHYPIRKGFLKRTVGYVKAVDGIDLDIGSGETVALVGESGCGKTTAGKGLVRLVDITEGTVSYRGKDLGRMSAGQMRKLRGEIQIMFQDPYGSLNPRMMVNRIIAEGLIGRNKAERDKTVEELMDKVGLDPGMMYRYPHEFSGGQRQRIGIARFLAVRPKFVVCDEVTSALDVSVQAQVLNLLKDLQKKEGLSYLFITHNLSVVSYIAERVAVMYLGRIVERGTVQEIFDHPRHPYTQALLAASPRIGENGREKIVLEGEVPSPVNPPPGCHFHPRCPEAKAVCREKYPGVSSFSTSHSTQCWLYL